MSATDGSEFLAEWAARQDRRHAGPNARNKAAILPILAAAGIKTVTVTFDGYGDEGAIESVEALDGSDEPTVLPDVELEASIASWADNDPETLERGPLEAVIRELALGCLAQKFDGWEDGHGAHGDLVIDVAAGTMTLHCNMRFVESTAHTVTF